MFDALIQEYGDCKAPSAIVETTSARYLEAKFIRPQKHKKLPYHQLKCTDKDRDTIHIIISNTAERNILWLAANRSDFYRMGEEITHVHPLKFLEIIFSSPYLKQCMSKIFNDFIKHPLFMRDLAANLRAKHETGELLCHAAPFAKELDLQVEEIIPLLEDQDWNGLMRHLIQ